MRGRIPETLICPKCESEIDTFIGTYVEGDHCWFGEGGYIESSYGAAFDVVYDDYECPSCNESIKEFIETKEHEFGRLLREGSKKKKKKKIEPVEDFDL